MTTTPAKGYNNKFVDEKKSSKYKCPVCKLVLRDPQQTACGHLICESCLQRLKDKGNNFTCPNCHVDLTGNFFPDNHINRKVKSLQVYCNNKDDGCQWKGDLKDIEDHLQECPYQLVSCSNDCGMDLQRRHLQNHLKNDCPKRLIKCQYCNEEGRHQVITGDHLGVCPEYPIRCENEGCGQLIPHQQMPSHKASCPKEIISCGYRSVGCEEKMKREEQEEHNDKFIKKHLELTLKEVATLKTAKETLQSKLEASKCLSKKIGQLQGEVISVKLSKFGELKRTNCIWYSPGFYTSPGGYKMCLRVDANGDGDGKDTHVSCYICLMSGEYDDILEWPFHGEVTIELLNQLEDKNHHKYLVHFNESTPQKYKSKVIGRECAASGYGYPQFISHSQLKVDVNPSLNRQYLKDDTLYFRVSVEVTSNTKPWLVG